MTPHDGPSRTGNHVWDDNNLAQKNLSIVGTDIGSDFAIATVVGHEENRADYLLIEVNRGRLPREVELYVDLLDPLLRRRLRKFLSASSQEPLRCEMAHAINTVRTLGSTALVSADDTGSATLLPLQPRQQALRVGWHNGHEVVFLRTKPRVQVPIYAGQGRLSAIIVGGLVGKGAKPGEYEIILIQRQPSGEISGSAVLALTIGR